MHRHIYIYTSLYLDTHVLTSILSLPSYPFPPLPSLIHMHLHPLPLPLQLHAHTPTHWAVVISTLMYLHKLTMSFLLPLLYFTFTSCNSLVVSSGKNGGLTHSPSWVYYLCTCAGLHTDVHTLAPYPHPHPDHTHNLLSSSVHRQQLKPSCQQALEWMSNPDASTLPH